ncbi:MAG: hypothetical protein IKS49_04455 [Actinomycetaceae bacterium]|nr:hypothetical protein [Actinomycetaceae bacterium]
MKKRLLAASAALIALTGTLSGCESDEHKEAVAQVQSAWEAYEKAYENAKPDIEYCAANMWNCNAQYEGYDGWAIDADEPTLKEEAEKRISHLEETFKNGESYNNVFLKEITVKWTTENGLDKEETFALPLDKKALDEDDGLPIEQLMTVKDRLTSAAISLEGANSPEAPRNSYKEEADASNKRLKEMMGAYSKSCTKRKEQIAEAEKYNIEEKDTLFFFPRDVPVWADEHERACKIAGTYDENKEYTTEELVNLIGDFWGIDNLYAQGSQK